MSGNALTFSLELKYIVASVVWEFDCIFIDYLTVQSLTGNAKDEPQRLQ